MASNKPFDPNPQIKVLDFEDKEHTGKYISHTKTGRVYSNLVLENAKGIRFRVVAITTDVDDALAAARGEVY